jgi:hypothetical protein
MNSPIKTSAKLATLMRILIVVADSLIPRVKLTAKTPNANSQIRGGSKKKEVFGDL